MKGHRMRTPRGLLLVGIGFALLAIMSGILGVTLSLAGNPWMTPVGQVASTASAITVTLLLAYLWLTHSDKH